MVVSRVVIRMQSRILNAGTNDKSECPTIDGKCTHPKRGTRTGCDCITEYCGLIHAYPKSFKCPFDIHAELRGGQ